MADFLSVKKMVFASLDKRRRQDTPYTHWYLRDLFPGDVLADLQNLPFTVANLGGVSGTREVHNSSRNYFDAGNRRKHPVCDLTARVFQDREVSANISDCFGVDLSGKYLRMEYAQDTDSFWLEPHTDIGVKSFTMLIYLSDDVGHADLGTDIYASKEEHVGRSPFGPNLAMVFIPADNTWHGFEKRSITGVRQSIVLNYVTDEWRAREQLSFPDEAIMN